MSDVGFVKPFNIGGIDGGSRGPCIREDGDFNDLGRVGLATRAAANILSKTRLIDAGHAVSYDADVDVYHLDGAHRSYTFSRKIYGNRFRSSHYACDMAGSRTDGEGALGAMRDELSGLGIVLNTSGPSQHVPVIER